MEVDKLVTRELYFALGFAGPKSIPVITTYEYVGKATKEKGYFEEAYIFKLHPHYTAYDEDGVKVAPQKERFHISEKSVKSLYTLPELISVLQKMVTAQQKRQ